MGFPWLSLCFSVDELSIRRLCLNSNNLVFDRYDFICRMSKFTVRTGQVSSGGRKVYSAGGAKRPSGYHLGKPSDAIDGSKNPSDAVPYKGQNYEEIKSHCLSNNTLFEDPEFPAIESSLFFSGKKPPRPFVWKRPKVFMIQILRENKGQCFGISLPWQEIL